MFKKILLISSLLLCANVYAAGYLDTQYGQDGLEVHIKKITIKKNIMTVIFEMENAGDEDIKSDSFPVSAVSYNTTDANHQVLRDDAGKWMVSSISYTFSSDAIFTASHVPTVSYALKKGKKKIGWIKFETPNDGDWPIELNFPDVTPFTLNKPQ
ncbi:MAG: hypothetical protein ACRBHB_24540 [Arenicella sp.]